MTRRRSSAALGTEQRAGRVLRPRRDHEGLRAAAECSFEGPGKGSFIVDRDGDETKTERLSQIEELRIAGIFDGDLVAGGEHGAEDPLDTVESSADDRDAGRGDAVGGQGERVPARRGHRC